MLLCDVVHKVTLRRITYVTLSTNVRDHDMIITTSKTLKTAKVHGLA